METAIPPAITTLDKVETRVGTLKFDGGYPDAATVEKVYDNLDFQRGMEGEAVQIYRSVNISKVLAKRSAAKARLITPIAPASCIGGHKSM